MRIQIQKLKSAVLKVQSTFLLLILGTALNFLFQIYLARMLSIANYGKFAAIWTAISTAGLITSGLQNQTTASTIKAISDPLQKENDKNLLNTTMLSLSGLSLLIFIALNIVSGLQINTVISILMISLSIPISGLTAIALGRVLGWKGIKSFLTLGLVLSSMKFLAAIMVLPFTQNAHIIILMVLLMQLIISILVVRFENKKVPPLTGKFFNIDNLKLMLPTTLYWALVYVDVPMFRFHASEENAGIYSGVSNLTKIPLILGASVNTFILSSRLFEVSTSESRKYLSRILKLFFLFYFLFFIAAAFFGDLVVNVTLGARYEQSGLIVRQLMGYFAVYCFGFFTILNFERLSTPKLQLLLSLFVFQIATLMIFKLGLEEFLIAYSIFPALMTLVLVWRKNLTNFSKQSK
jgi:O-antigen/teichoic acid export membrane protein